MRFENQRVQYQYQNTVIHNLSPVVKAIWVIMISLSAFLLHGYLEETILLLLVILIGFIGRFPFLRTRAIRVLFCTVLFLGMIHIVFNKQGEIIADLNLIIITRSGFEKAVYISARFAVIVLIGFIFIYTTETNALLYSLMKIGMPYRFGFAVITSMRLVPVFGNEVDQIYYAQLSKGVKYRLFPIEKFLGNIVQFLRLLMISIIRQVDAMVISMEGRSFGLSARRTFSREVDFSYLDYVSIFVGVILLVIVSIEKMFKFID
jgi:energy-coupling factor transport system permease protein